MWKQNMDIDLGHKAQNGTCYFNKTSPSDIFSAKTRPILTVWLVPNKVLKYLDGRK